MVIFSKSRIIEYGQEHADSLKPLLDWYRITKQADWSNINDVKQTFNSADYVGNDRFVFNIKGNKYRLVAVILFDIRTIYIKFVGTHAKYDKIDVSKI